MKNIIKIDKKLIELGLKVRYIIGQNVVIEKNSVLDNLKRDTIKEITQNWNEDKTKINPILLEYKKLHQLTIGEKGLEYSASPEWLIKFVLSKNKFININNIVDCYNLVSVKTQIAIGSHDLSKVEGSLKFSYLVGDERFIPLGLNNTLKVPEGAYAFTDDNDVLCLFESRQSEKTKITIQTSTFITYLQGNFQTSDQYLNQAALSLLNLYRQFCKGTFILDNNNKNMMMVPAGGG